MEKKTKTKKKYVGRSILIILALILIIFLILIFRKVIILSKISGITIGYSNQDNFYGEMYTYDNKNFSVIKTYRLDGNYLTTVSLYANGNEEHRKITMYKNGDEELSLIEAGDNKTVINNDNTISINTSVVNSYNYQNSIWDRIRLALVFKITKQELYSKECYVLENNNWKIYIDANTGLLVREEQNSYVRDYFYELNTVIQEDLQKPDTTGFKEAR